MKIQRDDYEEHCIDRSRSDGGRYRVFRRAVRNAGPANNKNMKFSIGENNGYGIATATGNNVFINRSIISGNSKAGIEADGGAPVTFQIAG